MAYSVRHAEGPAAAADLEVITGLWARTLAQPGDLRAYFRWYYEDNPLGAATCFLLYSDTGEAVGCAGLGRRTFYQAGRPLQAALLGDFAVLPQHRTLMPALLLQRAVRGHARGAFDLAYGFPNQQALPVVRRVGFQPVGVMGRYVRPLRHGPVLARHLPALPFPAAFGRALDLGAAAARALRGRSRGRARLDWLDDFDARFDRLWAAEHRRHPLIADRGAAFLRWRFSRKPGERFAIAALLIDDALAAYAVLQWEGQRVHLRDLFGTAPGLELLLLRLQSELYRAGAEAISVRFLGADWLVALLRRAGFRPREADRAVVFDPPPAADQLYITDADEDT
jgi:hypothetical protein